METRNRQLEHGQPMEQTRVLFCTCDSGVTRCQSQHGHQYHFRRISSMFESVLHWQVRMAAVNEILCSSRGYERLQKIDKVMRPKCKYCSMNR